MSSRRRPAVVAVPRTQHRAGTLVLTWSLSRPAAARCGLAAAGGKSPPMLELRLPARGEVQSGTIAATVIDGESRGMIPAQGRGMWVYDSDLWHLDIPGLLAVTVRVEQGAVRVLYARTEILARLGLRGGRYELEAGSLLTA